MPININEWEQELQQLLSEFDELAHCSLVMDTDSARADEVSWMICSFDGELSDALWDAVHQYGGTLQMSIKQSTTTHRINNLVFTVVEPSDSVMRQLHNYSKVQYQYASARTWPFPILVVAFLAAALSTGYWASALLRHWENSAQPWESVLHWAVEMLAYLWPL